MEELGEGKHYREMIRNEIAERLTAIKKIEKMRKGVDAKRTTVNQINWNHDILYIIIKLDLFMYLLTTFI